MKNLYQELKTIEQLYNYLENNGQQFNQYGYPVFRKEMFLETWPQIMVPFYYRHQIADSRTAVICFYTKDRDIYPRITKGFAEISIYQDYLGVVAPDITVTDDMDAEVQWTILLLNQLFMAYLAHQGIKVIANTRCPTGLHKEVFAGVPGRVMCASGTLSCKNLQQPYDYGYLEKILSLAPSKLLIYGKEDKIMLEQLTTLGIDFKRYDEIRKYLRGRELSA